MAGALGPVGYGARGSMRRTIAVHTTGLTIGAAISALILINIGNLLRAIWLYLPLVVVLASASLMLVQMLGLKVFQSKWQVPEVWRRALDMDLLALSYGLILGLGVFTSIVTSAFWVFVGLSLVVTPLSALVGWCVYAIARGAGVAWMIMRSDRRDRPLSRGELRLLVGLSGCLSFLVVGLYGF